MTPIISEASLFGMRLVNVRSRGDSSLPSDQELRSIKKGDWVKIASDGVRFWIQIQKKSGCGWSALTSDDQRVTVRPENIMGIAPAFSGIAHQEEADEPESAGGAGTIFVIGGILAGIYLMSR